MKLQESRSIFFGCLLVLIVQGCGPKTFYMKDGGTPEDFEAAKKDCMYEMGYAGTNQKYLTFGDLINVKEDMHHCLTYRKGWRLDTIEGAVE